MLAQDTSQADERLNLTDTEKASSERRHLSHGVPTLHATAVNDTCLLHHEDYVTAYSGHIRMPLYAAFNLTAGQVFSTLLHVKSSAANRKVG